MNNIGLIKSDISLLNSDRYCKNVYENWFLGSRGRKVTLARTTPDDMSLLYPEFQTKFEYTIPQIDINVVGDFNIFYDMQQMRLDYYNKNAYDSYSYSNKQYIYIKNLMADNNKKILVIKNSFANVVTPFLATQCRELEILDVRQFTGSVRSFIKKHKPDIVIVLYHIGELIIKVNYDTHKCSWDFR